MNSNYSNKTKYTPSEIYNNLIQNPELTYGDILCFILLMDNAESYFSHKKNKLEHVYQDTQTGFYKKFGISKPTISRAFKKLTSLGYIKQNGLNINLFPEGESNDNKATSNSKTNLINSVTQKSLELKSDPLDFIF